MFDIGDFIKIVNDDNKNKKKILSSYPGLIVKKYDKQLLVSIVEYKGDYIFCENKDVKKMVLKPQEELYILSKFGNWFYDLHKLLYQSIILKNIY